MRSQRGAPPARPDLLGYVYAPTPETRLDHPADAAAGSGASGAAHRQTQSLRGVRC